MEETIAPDQPCPGCGGALYRLTLPTDPGDPTTTGLGRVSRCTGRCELADGVAGVIAAPRR